MSAWYSDDVRESVVSDTALDFDSDLWFCLSDVGRLCRFPISDQHGGRAAEAVCEAADRCWRQTHPGGEMDRSLWGAFTTIAYLLFPKQKLVLCWKFYLKCCSTWEIMHLIVHLLLYRCLIKCFLFQVFDSLLNGDIFPYPSFFHNATGCTNYFNYMQCQVQRHFDPTCIRKTFVFERN